MQLISGKPHRYLNNQSKLSFFDPDSKNLVGFPILPPYYLPDCIQSVMLDDLKAILSPADQSLFLEQEKGSLMYYVSEHFRISGVYWGATALALLKHLGDMDGDAIVEWVLSCQHSNGAFGGSERHDPGLLYTTSAVQILALYDKLDLINADQIAACKSQNPLASRAHHTDTGASSDVLRIVWELIGPVLAVTEDLMRGSALKRGSRATLRSISALVVLRPLSPSIVTSAQE